MTTTPQSDEPVITIGTYVEFLTWEGLETGYRFQNFHFDETRVFQDKIYIHAPMGYSGASLNIEAANTSAQLVFGLTDQALSVCEQASADKWVATVHTVWLDDETLEELDLYLSEVYTVLGYEHSAGDRVFMRLGSALDALSGQLPRRVLTRKMVGSLPSTGAVGFR